MDFSSALNALKLGLNVARKAWRKDVWISLSHERFYVHATGKPARECNILAEDILAEDWEIVD
jgi:hypothetical protein